MKKCSKCRIEKEVKEFSKNKTKKDGLVDWCKKCVAFWNESRKEEKAIYDKQYYEKHREEKAKHDKQYYEEHREEKAARDRCRYKENREEMLIRHQQWQENNPDYYKRYNEKYREEKTKYQRERRRNDPIIRLECNIRRRFGLWLNGNKKSKGTFQYVNCTKEELIEHLEKLFYDNPETGEKMTWDNYGKWHIDHDTPLSLFDPTNEKNMHEAWRKENLRPLWAKDNLRKSNKCVKSLK